MKLLVLGGTRFVGHHLVAEAVQRGHEVTLFNRGLSQPQARTDVESITGDRDGGLQALAGRRWDVVIDTSGYVPRLVEASARFLTDSTDRYLFISTISVYADFSTPGLTETSPLATTADPTVEEITRQTYGPLKVLCEQAVQAAVPERALIIRPGLIVGPQDPTDRFTYWLLRVARGGRVLSPGRSDYPTQFIDIRDLVRWTLDLTQARQAGIYHATSPAYAHNMGDLLETCRSVSCSDASFSWVPDGFLLDQGIVPWTGLPLWLPESRHGLVTVDCSKACAAGLRTRPLEDTVRDTLAWAHARGDVALKAGLTPEHELRLMTEWSESGYAQGRRL